MSGKYKLDVTRPEFMLQMMSDGDVDRLDNSSMKKVLYDTSTLSYVVYTAMMETDPKKAEFEDIINDGESIAVRFKSKSQAKKVAAACDNKKVRYGFGKYIISTKVRDNYTIFTVEED